ncbi:phenylacetate--CoA ligase family protein [Desulfovibrio ferrophilus]|uniref:Putative capsular polysaccharide biosynthesis protein n=1 Tax=Desulfovibrio ferrophilus TaxID=241368 RepID=A0A2Z6B1C7_9BACT|nr:phenylacetate--CoA ligase family protein [Desulfovibrio ferrophilus]BBD09327.1 putative capsular polysaccharide biosynthesis protein [Desulfovibrio ferrophilus]
MSHNEHLPTTEAPNPLNTPLFTERVEFLKSSQWWNKEQLDQFQLKQLQHQLWFVSSHVPHYRELFRSLGFSWQDADSLSVLKQLPLLTKQEMQENPKRFIPDYMKADRLYHRSTGGSTGMPLTIFMDLDHLSRDKANTQYYMSTMDLDIFHFRSIRLYGDRVPEEQLSKGHFWHQANDRMLTMSCYHFSKETSPLFVDKINAYSPDYIHTRPSAILPLASYILELGLTVSAKLVSIFADGEYLTLGQRKVIESAFKTRLYNVYGHTEGCVFGHACKDSDNLHFPPQVGILELIDDEGHTVSREGGRGEMVTTGFNNKMFPMVRYRTGDIGVLTNKQCTCGRHYPMLKAVEGRFQDYVVDKHERLVPLAPAVFNYNDFDWRGIAEFQVHQTRAGHLVFKVHRDQDCAESVEAMTQRLKTDLFPIFGKTFEMDVTYVDGISRSAIGKLRYLEQNLDIQKFSRTFSGV